MCFYYYETNEYKSTRDYIRWRPLSTDFFLSLSLFLYIFPHIVAGFLYDEIIMIRTIKNRIKELKTLIVIYQPERICHIFNVFHHFEILNIVKDWIRLNEFFNFLSRFPKPTPTWIIAYWFKTLIMKLIPIAVDSAAFMSRSTICFWKYPHLFFHQIQFMKNFSEQNDKSTFLVIIVICKNNEYLWHVPMFLMYGFHETS